MRWVDPAGGAGGGEASAGILPSRLSACLSLSQFEPSNPPSWIRPIPPPNDPACVSSWANMGSIIPAAGRPRPTSETRWPVTACAAAFPAASLTLTRTTRAGLAMSFAVSGALSGRRKSVAETVTSAPLIVAPESTLFRVKLAEVTAPPPMSSGGSLKCRKICGWPPATASV